LCKALDDTRPDEVRLAAAASLAQHAARMEGTLVDPRAVKALVATKSASSPSVRKVAAFALGFMGGDEATAGLKSILDDSDRDVRYNAALALGRRDDPAALGNFREMLSDKDLEVLCNDTPKAERSSKIESIELEALNSLNTAAGKGKTTLLTTLKSEVDVLTRSGLVSVRSRAQEVLKSLQTSK
jgi:HEAT repeat protein